VARRHRAAAAPAAVPGFDTLGTLAHIMHSGHDHTWFVLTQKIIEKEFAPLGGLQTDLSSRVLTASGEPLPGLYAAGEIAGFGGGVHGYRALEGTFLGGCLFSGRVAGRAAAGALA
jgi:predicted oxidoreductase